MSRLLKAVQMSLWGIAWLTCAKCGSMEDENRVFSKMPLRNVISWNSILVAFAMHWHGNIPWLYSFLAHLFEMMLFIFCQLVAMQVWWMKACTVMVP